MIVAPAAMSEIGLPMIRQLLYVSSSNPPGAKVPLDPIYDRSRHNNALDGVSGLLFSDGYRFLQVLEGSPEAIDATMARIRADDRHRHIHVLRDATVEQREFGHWSMADRRKGEQAAEFEQRLRELLGRAAPDTREAFLDLLEPEAKAG